MMVYGRGIGFAHPMVVAGLIALIGCATTTAPSKSPQVAADLRPSPHAEGVISHEERAKQFFIRGMTEAHIGNHEAAIDLYARAMRLAPDAAAVYSAAAESHEALGDETTAGYHAVRARELAPENPHFHSQLAQLYMSRGESEKAAGIYQEMRELFPHNPDMLYELARIYTIEGEYARAIETYEALLAEIGGDRDIQEEMLHLYGRLDDLAGSENLLRKMIEEQPHDPQLRRMLSELYVRQDRHADAAVQLEAALDENPGNVETLLALTELYRGLGQADSADALLERAANVDAATPGELLLQIAPLYSRAENDPEAMRTAEQLLERTLEMDPENADALVMLGDIRLSRGEADEAGELLYKALEQNPRDPHLWIQSAGAFLQAGNAERSIEVSDEGLLLFPGFLPLLRLSGYALMDTYQNRTAIARFEEAIRIIREDRSEADTELADMLGALGLLFSRVNDFDAADEAYEEAIGSDPNDPVVLNNYAFSLADRGLRLDYAGELAERAVELEPDSASFLDTLGWVYFKRGEFSTAHRWLLRATQADGASAAVYEHLGDTYEALGDEDGAREAWSRALEMRPDSTSLMRKLGRSQ